MMAWVCEFSPIQQAFHVDTLERVLEANRQTIARGEISGFVPLAIFPSSEKAHLFAECWRRAYPWKEAGLYRGYQPPPLSNYKE